MNELVLQSYLNIGLAIALTTQAGAANPNSEITLLSTARIVFDTTLGHQPPSEEAIMRVANSGRGAVRWSLGTDVTFSSGLLLPHHETKITVTLGNIASLTVGRYIAAVFFTNESGLRPGPTATVVLVVRTPPPTFVNEPAFTRGTSNTLFWQRSPAANEYRIQISASPDFAGALSTEWQSETNYTFKDLLDGTTYFYRVQSRSNLLFWSQTLAYQFATNENLSVRHQRLAGVIAQSLFNSVRVSLFEYPHIYLCRGIFRDYVAAR